MSSPINSSSNSNNNNKYTNLSNTPVPYMAIPVPRTSQSIRPSRGSFLNSPMGSFKGVNSLGRFASSFQRAQSFRSLEPRLKAQRSYFLDDDDQLYDPNTLAPSRLGRKLSTVFNNSPVPITFQNLRGSNNTGNENGAYGSTYDDDEAIDDNSFIDQTYTNWSRANSIQSHLNPNLIGSTLNQVTSRSNSIFEDNDKLTPLVLKKITNSEGKTVTVIAGQSTAPQTIFNSINVLIGVGLLALPVGLNLSGWYLGSFLLMVCAFSTYWTATLLSDCLDTDQTLMTYADLGFAAFGNRARLFISILFSIDLLGVGVSLIILFADSLNSLFPNISVITFKIIAFFVLTPLSFLPLRILSNISLLGITSTISLVLLVVILGLTKHTSPGSLLSPMPTNLYPKDFKDVLLALGIIMGPFGGHAIFPNLKSDMRHPDKFEETLRTTYAVTFLTDTTMALVGFAMFGLLVKDEVTKSVLTTPGYPKFVYILICIMVSIVPLAKTPLNAGPIINIIEFIFGIASNSHSTAAEEDGDKSNDKKQIGVKILKIIIKLFVNGMFVFVSIIYPKFDRIIGLSGASLCSIICIILPCSFYLKLCKPKGNQRLKYYTAIILGTFFGITATYAAIVF